MFECDKCKGEATYDYQKKAFLCTECGHIREVKPSQTRCFSCGSTYTEYTWFDPSGCSKCHRSFVD